MVQLSLFFVAASLVVAGLSSPTRRTVAQVEADIATMSTQASALNKAIVAFPTKGGTMSEALALHNDATSLVTALNKGAADAKATTSVSETDGRTILADVQQFVNMVSQCLKNIVQKKAAFQSLPASGVPAIVKQDLSNLNQATMSFGAALIENTPPDLKGQAAAIKSTVDSDFATAMAAYN